MNPQTLYHALRGNPDEVVEAFKNGARSDLSDGNGQGPGFYVWRDRNHALKHIEFLKDRINGEGLIVTVEDTLDPKYWDIDVEFNSHLVASFIRDNFQMFQQIPDKRINTTYGALLPSKSRRVESRICEGNIVLAFDTGKSTKTIAMDTRFNEASVGKAHVLGTVINYLKNSNPQETYLARELWLSDQGTRALAYRGHEPLKVTGIERLAEQVLV